MGAKRLAPETEKKLNAVFDFLSSGKLPPPPEAPEMNEELAKLRTEIASLRAVVEALVERLAAPKPKPPQHPGEPEKVVLGPMKEPGTAVEYPAGA